MGGVRGPLVGNCQVGYITNPCVKNGRVWIGCLRDKCGTVLGMCVLGMSVSIDGHHCAGGCHPQVGRGHALHDWQGHQITPLFYSTSPPLSFQSTVSDLFLDVCLFVHT